MTDLIFVSLENWDDIWRRNQFVCAQLARRHPDKRILFVALPRDVSYHVRKRSFSQLKGPLTYGVAGYPNIAITHPIKLLPNSSAWGRRVNESMFRRHVRKVAQHIQLDKNPLLWVNAHWANHMVGQMGECGSIYDITDDWTTLTQSPEATTAVLAQDADLCARADRTIVCSQRLYDLKAEFLKSQIPNPQSEIASRLHLIPNGVDADHYRPAFDRTATFPLQAAIWPKPIFGYTGTIHPDRVDLDLLDQLATTLTRGTIVLVGPNLLSPEQQQRFARHKNVFFAGSVPYRDIPNFMAVFDVCITPHLQTPFTESLNPIKLWEYLAVGKPIVSTNIAGFRDFPQFVYLANGAAEFAAAMQQSLSEEPAKAHARRREAQKHSWSSRVDAIEAVMRSAIEHRRTAAAGCSTSPPPQPANVS